MKKHRLKYRYIFPKLTMFLLLIASIVYAGFNTTYAWLKMTSATGIYPYYDIELVTPSDSFYFVAEYTYGEEYNEETGQYEIVYHDVSELRGSPLVVYPGYRIYFRFKIINYGETDTSVSINFTNIIDTRLKDPETGEPSDHYLSENIIFGSTTFNGLNTGNVSADAGFFYYVSERMNFDPEVLEEYEPAGTICESTSTECVLNKSNLSFASNLNIAVTPLKEGRTQAQFEAALADVEANSTDYENDKRNLYFEYYDCINLDWYMILDRNAGNETTNSLFQMGRIVFSLD